MIPVSRQICHRRRRSAFGASALLIAVLNIGGVNTASAQDGQDARVRITEIGFVAKRFPPESIGTVEAADRALAEIDRERDQVEARYAREEQRCGPKFFSTSCIEDADEARRQALRQLRSVEIEANQVKRQAAVTSRDEALAAKREKEGATGQEQDAAAREAVAGVSARGSGLSQGTAPQPTDKPLPSGKPRGDDRVAEHEEKMRLIREKEAAEADKRAKNIAAYERKVQAAEARQKELAKRKEEKARKLEEKKLRAEGAGAGPK